jgi:YgiT-type zinc finger domain-containing protein
MRPGLALLTFSRGDAITVLRNVPAEICDFCGDEYLDEATSRRVEQLLNEPCATDVEVEVREYSAA